MEQPTKAQADRGADVIKIVDSSDDPKDLPGFIESIQRILEVTGKKLLFLVSGGDRILREFGPALGVCMYLTVHHHGEFDTHEQPLLKDVVAIDRAIRYPEEAIKRKIEGKIYTRFIVEKDGSITNAEIIRDIVYGNEEADSLAVRLGCGAEVIRVINMMPKWKPASDCGTIVRYQFILPVMFSLSEGIINPLSM